MVSDDEEYEDDGRQYDDCDTAIRPDCDDDG